MKSSPNRVQTPRVAILTGGADRPYSLALATALIENGLRLDFIASNEHVPSTLQTDPRVNFLNLRGNQRTDASFATKAKRVVLYYMRLVHYAFNSSCEVFHILWNNKFIVFDRTALTIYYKLLGKRIVFTAHNINQAKRDGKDSWINRLSLRIQYTLVDHIFVHNNEMRNELLTDFSIPFDKISVIPFGINDTTPNTALSSAEAREKLSLKPDHHVLLFFGNIAPYKGLDYLIDAFRSARQTDSDLRLVIAGRIKGDEDYWRLIEEKIKHPSIHDSIVSHIYYISDDDTEIYFKAADALVLPYTCIFQSGVLFLSYNFGLPVLATDVGSFRKDIIEGKTGFISPLCDSEALAATISRYFESNLFQNLSTNRQLIIDHGRQHHSWATIAKATIASYSPERTLDSTLQDPARREKH